MQNKKVKMFFVTVMLGICLAGCANNPEKITANVSQNLSDALSSNEADDLTEDSLNSLLDDAENLEALFSKRDLNATPDLSDAISIIAEDNSVYTISEEGIYIVKGNANNFEISVEADAKDKVQIVLDGTMISNESTPAIYVKTADKCFVTLVGENSLTVSEEFSVDGDTNADAVIFSKCDLTLNGAGLVSILSAYGNGITGKDDLKITGGSYEITSRLHGIEANDSIAIADGEFMVVSQKDGIHCANDEDLGDIIILNGNYNITAASDGIQANASLTINGGNYEMKSEEGLEATVVQINGGDIKIDANDDGINAARKNADYQPLIEINGGDIEIVMGPGDTDGLDSNGGIIVNGGTISVTGNSTFDYETFAEFNGGTIIVNGEQVDEIPQSMMGGPGNHGGRFGEGNPESDGGEWKQDGPGGKPERGEFGNPEGRENFDGQMPPGDVNGNHENFGGHGKKDRMDFPENMEMPEGVDRVGWPKNIEDIEKTESAGRLEKTETQEEN